MKPILDLSRDTSLNPFAPIAARFPFLVEMNMHPLEALIAEGEHQRQDFKFEISDSKKIARTLSAFANTDGGRLLIGVKDNGRIAGVRSEEEYYMIEAASERYTRPAVPFTARRWEVGGRTVLEIDIERGPDRPYLAPDKDDQYVAYLRVADENRPADPTLVLAWKKLRRPDGRLFRLTRPVEALFRHLETHSSVSLSEFCRVAHIRRPVARHILSDLLAIGTLRYTFLPDDGRLVYSRAEAEE